METLSSKFDTLVSMDMISLELPSYIKENLNKKFELRPYQEEAFGRFAFFMDSYTKKKKPVHLLFNMATGSGKTIIMASCILSLYEKGYRNFVFFVNSKSIIEKTKDNFLNNLSSKYLFGEKIVINNKEVNICQVDNFQSTNDNDINILFTTIQGLHTSLNEPSENSITYEDFEENRVVLIADEAHHINSSTKSKLSKDEELEDTSWEYTVNKIFQHSAENILLEFTATIDLDNKNIYEKYEDKLIYKYSLAEFRENKYSKEVKILSADLEEIDRALNAIILSQYRLKIAEKYKLFIKPIILMKSKTIAESKAFEEKFNILIDGLNAEKINRIKVLTRSGVMLRAFNFFDSENISMDNLALEMKEAYSIEKTISVNSKDESEAKQLTINSLEDENNQIRVVFAVDKLNEGWDVLNLFDIVRLYTTRDSDKGKPGKTTMAEAQLIGRGARYNPFSLNGEDKFTRKYDSDLENDLRILEELYYHSAQDSRYISELHNALVKEGAIADRTVQCKLEIKESFKETDFWKYGRIFVNSRRDNTNVNIFGFENTQIKKVYRYSLKTKTIQSINVLDKISELKTAETKDKKIHLSSFGKNIIKKAMAKNEFFTFSSIKKYFPHLSSVNEFIEDEKYLGNVSVEITGVESQITALNQSDKLDIAMDILNKIKNDITSNTSEWQGTKEFEPKQISSVFKDKIINITMGDKQERGKGMRETSNELLHLDLRDKDWYIHTENFGTDQEKMLVRFIHSCIDELKEAYDEVYLLRNERDFWLYSFISGARFEPDFILFLRERNNTDLTTYQIFIEPKAAHLIATDAWKEEFLKSIENEYRISLKIENQDFKLIGLPFYNKEEREEEFKTELEKIADISL